MIEVRMAHRPFLFRMAARYGRCSVAFLSAALTPAQAQISLQAQLVFTPYHPTGIYELGEKAGGQ